MESPGECHHKCCRWRPAIEAGSALISVRVQQGKKFSVANLVRCWPFPQFFFQMLIFPNGNQNQIQNPDDTFRSLKPIVQVKEDQLEREKQERESKKF